MPGDNEVKVGAEQAAGVEAPKPEVPKSEATPKVEAPKPEAPKPEAPKPEVEQKPLTDLKITKPVETPKIDLSKALTEFGKNGKVTDATYAEAEKQGMARADVDTYLAGHQSRVQGVVTKLSEIAGGQDNLRTLIEWAGANTDDATREAFNGAMDRGDLPTASLMVRGLAAQYNDAVGVEGERVIGSGKGVGVQPYANWAQVSADMAKPEYKKDPAFRAKVGERLKASPI